MMPPSRCWTVLRFDADSTRPVAIAALSSGAQAAQMPANRTKIPAMALPAMTRPRIWAKGVGGGGAATAEKSVTAVMARCPPESAWSGCQPLLRLDRADDRARRGDTPG